MNDFFSRLETGNIASLFDDKATKDITWTPHPTLAGVSLKHMITGNDTDGRFSAHLVRLEPGAKISDHVHETQWELHEVAGGTGYCVLDGRHIPYEPGVAAILPENTPHMVQAHDGGLFLLAKFVPALM